jgi:hypothetical protein
MNDYAFGFRNDFGDICEEPHWTSWDYALASAYEDYLEYTTESGVPFWWEEMLNWDAHHQINKRDAAIESYRESHKKLPNGAGIYATVAENQKLPTLKDYIAWRERTNLDGGEVSQADLGDRTINISRLG